jgi:signal transduction histidine kinase
MSATSLPYNPRTISPIAHQIVLDNMPEGLIVVDTAGRVVEHNPAAETLAALNRQASDGPLAEATLDRALGAALAEMLAVVSDGPAEREIAVQVPQPRTLHITASALVDPNSGQLGALFMIRDVTQRVLTEAALARRVAELTLLNNVATAVASTLEPHNLLRTIVSTVSAAFGRAHTTVALLNDQRDGLTIAAESDTDKEISALGLTIPLHADVFGEPLRAGASITIEDAQHDERLAFMHDLLVRRRVHSLLMVPLRAGDQLIGTLNISSGARHQLGREELALTQIIAGYVAAGIAAAQLFDAAQQAGRLKSTILDTISHEFRTPITTILGFTELYQEQVLGPVTAEQQEALEAVSRGAHRLLKLVDDLLDLARLEAGKLDMSLHPVDVQLCIKESAALVAHQFEQKRLKLRTEIDGHLPFASADAMWLRRVLINLLTNALRFTNDGEVLVRAYEADEAAGNRHADNARQIAIEIADTGIGIAEGEQDMIFEAFQRAEGVQMHIPNSAGLGLAISQRVIEQMDGQITLHSRAGQGSTFTITLRACELELEHPQF